MTHEHHHHDHAHGQEELTPHSVLASLPMHAHAHPSILVAMPVAADGANAGPAKSSPARGEPRVSRSSDKRCPSITCSFYCPAFTGSSRPTPRTTRRHHPHHKRHHHGVKEPGPFREEGVLLSLQLFAYHSKYPHVRQASYKPRLSFRPAIVRQRKVARARHRHQPRLLERGTVQAGEEAHGLGLARRQTRTRPRRRRRISRRRATT
ncbi:hypothetical protein DFH11DRAFT_1620650, partial [Phellopilus nigrolimitatus]